MTSSYTPNLRLTLPVQGELAASWGDTVNNGITSLTDSAISGTASVVLSGTTYTLTSANGATDEARQMFITFSGTPGADATVVCPSVSKLYIVTNNTTGGFSVTVKTLAGSGIAVPNGKRMVLYCNATNVLDGIDYLASISLGTALTVPNGGTGAATLTGIVKASGTSAFTAVTAPSGAIVGTTDTQTLTNKRVTPRVSSTTSITSPLAWNSDNFDEYAATAQSNSLTINADAGTPTDGQKIIFRFKDNGTPQTLTWTTGTSKSFRVVGVTLPTVTVASKTLYVGCVYNSADTRWDALAVVQEV